MSKTHEIIKRIGHIVEVASTLAMIQKQIEKNGILFFQIEKNIRNLRKSVVIWTSHFWDRFKQNPDKELTEKEKSILCTGIATPLNEALTLLEKISSLPDVRSLSKEILFLEQAQETLAQYLNHFSSLIHSSADAEELAA